MVTTAASPALRALHERMPVVLPDDGRSASGSIPAQQDVAALLALLRAARETRLRRATR